MTGDPVRDQFYEPPGAPYRATRVRAVPVVVVLMLLIGTLAGGYYLAKQAGWLTPVSHDRSGATGDGVGLKSRITYPTTPAGFTDGAGRDLTKEQLEALRREQEALRKLLEAHLAQPHGAAAVKTAPAVQQKPPPKKHLSRVSYERKDPVTDLPGDRTELFAGTFIPGVLVTRVNSDREGTAVVRVREHVKDSRTGQQILIPQNSLIVMRYKSKDLVWGAERLEVGLEKLTLPDGRVVELPKEPGIDQIGQAGWVSEVHRHYWRLLTGVLIRGVLRGAAIEVAANGMPVASSVAQEGSQLGQTVTQPFIQTRPTIIVHEGEPVNIQPISGVTLPPYREPSHAIQ